MTYDVLGPGPLDYLPCRYAGSKLLFRGPRRSLDASYVAFLGSTETYGKFIETPYPALVEDTLGIPCANFGQINAGIDAFAHDPFVIDAAGRADVTVIQVLGAHNMTNRFYSVHPRRNDRFLQPATLLKTIYREVDFADYHFTRHLLGALVKVSAERFEVVRQELQDAWKARMRLLLNQIGGKTILLWFSERAPDHDRMGPRRIGTDPLFVTRAMMEEIAPLATEVIEVVASPRACAAGTEGMIFSEMDAPAAAEVMGPIAHAEAAAAVSAALQRML